VLEYFDAKPFTDKITKKTRLRYFRASNIPSGVYVPTSEATLQKDGKVAGSPF